MVMPTMGILNQMSGNLSCDPSSAPISFYDIEQVTQPLCTLISSSLNRGVGLDGVQDTFRHSVSLSYCRALYNLMGEVLPQEKTPNFSIFTIAYVIIASHKASCRFRQLSRTIAFRAVPFQANSGSNYHLYHLEHMVSLVTRK